MMKWLLGVVVYLVFFSPLMAQSGVPITTDSRVKTFVYSENDVFTILTHYGYQSNIEFAKNESIKTVSVGDRIAWQVIPSGRRLFIKALEENANTNMTVVTNKRAYQFDLRASGQQPLQPNEELVYVVRFFYPDAQPGGQMPPIYTDAMGASVVGVAPPAVQVPVQAAAPVAPVVAQVSMPEPVVMQPVAPPVAAQPMAQQAQLPAPLPPVIAQEPARPSRSLPSPALLTRESGVAAANTGGLNYNYTFTGPTEAAPLKIYDDGNATYFTFNAGTGSPPQFFVMSADGRETPVQPNVKPNGEMVVSMIAPRFAIRRGGANVMVYNENLASQAM